MRRDTKKPVAISTTIIGSVALLAAVVLLRGPLLEEWYLRDLEVYDIERSKRAAEWFGEHGSARAMQKRNVSTILRHLGSEFSVVPQRCGVAVSFLQLA